jgi:hypothetical protein
MVAISQATAAAKLIAGTSLAPAIDDNGRYCRPPDT